MPSQSSSPDRHQPCAKIYKLAVQAYENAASFSTDRVCDNPGCCRGRGHCGVLEEVYAFFMIIPGQAFLKKRAFRYKFI
jgi:hypothetical protein